jgi:hypothetical protein
MNSVFSAASCPPCHGYASCHNSTHCVCNDGFQPESRRSNFVKPYEECKGKDVMRFDLNHSLEKAIVVHVFSASNIHPQPT